jgi:CheY-like chemotaxis protein
MLHPSDEQTPRPQDAAVNDAPPSAEPKREAEWQEQLRRLNHDLRTPLTAMLAAVQVLSMDERMADDLRPYLDVLERNVVTLAHLADRLTELRSQATKSLPKSAPQAPARPVETREVRVLLVDDNEDTLFLIKMLLERRGYRVATALSASAAVAEAGKQPFDILVSDISLPDGSGTELLRSIAGRSHVLGIAMSGYGRDEDVARSKEAGFAEHLTKPIDIDRLETSIRRLLSTRAGRPPP